MTEHFSAAISSQIDLFSSTVTAVGEYWQSNFKNSSELSNIYKEMLEWKMDIKSFITTSGGYQNFMSHQKMRKELLEVGLNQLQLLKWEKWYLFPEQQRLENYIRANLAFTFTFDRPDFNIQWASEKNIYRWERVRILEFTPDVEREKQEKILLVAPISGHFSTLLRKTIQALIDDWKQVYITDWKSCLQMDSDTDTSLDSYTQDLCDVFEVLWEKWDFDVLSVCQPGPISMTALAAAEKNGTTLPRSLTLMASPIDTSVNPTKVWEVWENMTKVTLASAQLTSPISHKAVYPGTYQISNFISANLESHLEKFKQVAFKASPLSIEEEKTLEFYHEYFAVMDIPYDFFCETVERVFQDREWKSGVVSFKDEDMILSDISTPLCIIEWWKDDICGIWETKAALDIVWQEDTGDNYLLCENAWHYGVFAGKSFRKEVIPFMDAFIKKLDS